MSVKFYFVLTDYINMLVFIKTQFYASYLIYYLINCISVYKMDAQKILLSNKMKKCTTDFENCNTWSILKCFSKTK